MNDERHIIESPAGEILAITLNKEIADFMVRFIPGSASVHHISYYDFCYDGLREFLRRDRNRGD